MDSTQSENGSARRKLAGLSGSARRLLDYVALLEGISLQEGGARYAVLRRMARSPEPDMIADLRECTNAGIIAVVEGEPDTYTFTHESIRALIMQEIGEQRLPKLQARANAARGRGPTNDPS